MKGQHIAGLDSNVPSKLCVCACMNTGCQMSAHKKTWSAHEFSFKMIFLHIFHTCRSRYRWVLLNVAHRKFCAHTDFKKLEGTLFDRTSQLVPLTNSNDKGMMCSVSSAKVDWSRLYLTSLADLSCVWDNLICTIERLIEWHAQGFLRSQTNRKQPLQFVTWAETLNQ